MIVAATVAEKPVHSEDASTESLSVPLRSSSIESPIEGVESRLASIWEDLLGVPDIGVHDNFFELGGHSLMATRVIARIDNQFGVRLALREMFNAPTIRQLGELIAAQTERVAVPANAEEEGDREEFEL